MRPYDSLDNEELMDLINLMLDYYRATYKTNIIRGKAEVDEDIVIDFLDVDSIQETDDEFLFNEYTDFGFKVESDLTGLKCYITFFYYELDKADIDDTHTYDSLHSVTVPCEFGVTIYPFRFNKQTYLLKEIDIVVKK